MDASGPGLVGIKQGWALIECCVMMIIIIALITYYLVLRRAEEYIPLVTYATIQGEFTDTCKAKPGILANSCRLHGVPGRNLGILVLCHSWPSKTGWHRTVGNQTSK